MTSNQIDLPAATATPNATSVPIGTPTSLSDSLPSFQIPTPTNTPIPATLVGSVRANMETVGGDNVATWAVNVTNQGELPAQGVV